MKLFYILTYLALIPDIKRLISNKSKIIYFDLNSIKIIIYFKYMITYLIYSFYNVYTIYYSFSYGIIKSVMAKISVKPSNRLKL